VLPLFLPGGIRRGLARRNSKGEEKAETVFDQKTFMSAERSVKRAAADKR
jgi:hypothetical protein